jgi:porin
LNRIATAALAFFSAVANGSEYPSNQYLTGDWDGRRAAVRDRGVDLKLHYTAQPMYLASGGEDDDDGTYTHNIGVDLLLDMERLVGFGNTTLLVKFSQREGDSVSAENVAPSEGGNTFTVQEIFGGQTHKLANVQFNTGLMDQRLDLAYGRLVANDDFLRSPLYCQFVNNSFCGSPKAVFLQDPFTFSAYPTAQWGARARYDTPSRNWTLMGAVYDGDPELKGGDPNDNGDNKHGTSLKFGDNGAVFALESHYHRNRFSSDKLPGVYKIGGYYMSGDFRDIGRIDSRTTDGNAMVWLLADQMLIRERAGSSEGLSWFGTVVFSLEDQVNSMDEYFGTGLVYQGLFPNRPNDTTGLAITAGWYSDELNKARRLEGKAKQDYEAVIELNHRFVLGHGIEFQPDIQYIIDPAGTGDIDDALLIGAKVVVQF